MIDALSLIYYNCFCMKNIILLRLTIIENYSSIKKQDNYYITMYHKNKYNFIKSHNKNMCWDSFC